MYIKEICIEAFGGVKKRRIELTENLNVIYGENETGKSTVAAFIKFIFYGFSKSRSNSPLENREKDLYMPWDGSPAYGRIVICKDGEEFTVMRVNNGKTEKCQVCDSVGNKIPCPEGIGEHFFGISDVTYMGSAESMQCRGCKTGGSELASQIQNILYSADENASAAKALDKLNKLKSQYRHLVGEGGSLYELEQSEKELSEKLKTAMADNTAYIGYKAEYEKYLSGISEDEAMKKALEDERECFLLYEKTKSLDELAKLREEKACAEEAFSEKRANLPEDIISGANDIRSAEDTYKNAQNAATDAKEQYDARCREFESMRAPADISELEADEKRFTDAVKRRRSAMTASLVFLVTAVISVALAVFTEMMPIFALTGAFAIAAAVCVTMGVKHKKCAASTAEKYSADGANFAATVTKEKAYIAEYSEKEKALEASQLMCESCKSLENGAEEKLKTALGNFYENCKDTGKALAQVKLAIAQYNAAEMKLRECEIALRTFEKSIDETELLRIKETVKPPERPLKDIEYNLSFVKQRCDKRMEKAADAKSNIDRISATYVHPQEIFERLEELRKKYRNDTEHYDAICLAADVLSEADGEFKRSIAPVITSTAGSLLSEATQGKYGSVTANGDFGIYVDCDGEKKEIEYLSGGTKDLVYIAFRYGLLQLLYNGDAPMMIFDDAFAKIDDKRLPMLLAIIRKISEKTQTVILTCQSREAKELHKITNEFNLINL